MTSRATIDLNGFLENARPFPGQNRFVLGTFERGVTVYRQQIRALNLIHAFVDASSGENKVIAPGSRVAVIGGGAFGITAAAALAYANFQTTLFERQQFLLPLQRGCTTRWIHPTFYDWPDASSERETARLPILDWASYREDHDFGRQKRLPRGNAWYCSYRDLMIAKTIQRLVQAGVQLVRVKDALIRLRSDRHWIVQNNGLTVDRAVTWLVTDGKRIYLRDQKKAFWN
jgi:hypothetical protein